MQWMLFTYRPFLSSLARDFVEESSQSRPVRHGGLTFLSSLAQDFIEERYVINSATNRTRIPELSSSGLH